MNEFLKASVFSDVMSYNVVVVYRIFKEFCFFLHLSWRSWQFDSFKNQETFPDYRVLRLHNHLASPWFRLLVIVLLERRHWFDPRPVCVGFSLDTVIMGQVPSKYSCSVLWVTILPILLTHVFIYYWHHRNLVIDDVVKWQWFSIERASLKFHGDIFSTLCVRSLPSVSLWVREEICLTRQTQTEIRSRCLQNVCNTHDDVLTSPSYVPALHK